jgi:DNA-directed RNA polymerase subunit RPC12/RpoP
MVTTKFVCEDCEAIFTLKYNEDLVEGPPCLCPWCNSYISEEDNPEPDIYEDYEDQEDE